MSDATPAAGQIVVIRPAIAADAAAIAEIYNREVTETTATFDLVPRTLEAQQEWLAARSGAFAAIVGVDPATKRVVTFASLSRRTKSAPPIAPPSKTRSTSTATSVGAASAS